MNWRCGRCPSRKWGECAVTITVGRHHTSQLPSPMLSGGCSELLQSLLPCSYFLRDGVKAPLGIGDVLLEDGTEVKGFIGETYATNDAPDITAHGGWRAYLAAK